MVFIVAGGWIVGSVVVSLTGGGTVGSVVVSVAGGEVCGCQCSRKYTFRVGRKSDLCDNETPRNNVCTLGK